MEMGNEQSLFQRKCFHFLFAKKATVDTTSAFYAQQCQKVVSLSPNVQGFVKKGSGNRKIFRVLVSLCGMFIGISLGASLGAEAAAPWLIAFLTGAFGLIGTYCSLPWAYSLIHFNRSSIVISATTVILWLILGLAAAQFNLALWAVALIAISGMLLILAGRRTPEGRQAVAEVMGLRRYLRHTASADMTRICQENPGYYHDLAPYALALGANKKFARSFGKQHTFCPYIVDSKELSLTAAQWNVYMEQLVAAMNERNQSRYLERVVKIWKAIKSIKFN